MLADDIWRRKRILPTCVRPYAAYPLSWRQIQEMTAERGVEVDHSTIRG